MRFPGIACVSRSLLSPWRSFVDTPEGVLGGGGGGAPPAAPVRADPPDHILTPAQEVVIDSIKMLTGLKLERISEDIPCADDEIDYPIRSIIDEDGNYAKMKTTGTPGGTNFDDFGCLWSGRDNKKYQMIAIVAGKSIRFKEIQLEEVGEDEMAAFLKFFEPMESPVSTADELFLALRAAYDDAHNSWNYGVEKWPVTNLKQLHIDGLTPEQKEDHIRQMKGELLIYHYPDPVTGEEKEHRFTDPNVIPVYNHMEDYSVFEIVMLLRCKKPAVKAKHLFPIGTRGGKRTGGKRDKQMKRTMARYPNIAVGVYAAWVASVLENRGLERQKNDTVKLHFCAAENLVPAAGGHILQLEPEGGVSSHACKMVYMNQTRLTTAQLSGLVNSIVQGYYWRLVKDPDFCKHWYEWYEGCHAGCEQPKYNLCINFLHVFLGSSDVNKNLNKKCSGYISVYDGTKVTVYKACTCDAHPGNPGRQACMKVTEVGPYHELPVSVVAHN